MEHDRVRQVPQTFSLALEIGVPNGALDMSKNRPVLLADLLCLTHYKENELSTRFMWGCTVGIGVIVAAVLWFVDR